MSAAVAWILVLAGIGLGLCTDYTKTAWIASIAGVGLFYLRSRIIFRDWSDRL